METEMKREDVNKGQLVVLKFPLKNDYKMKDWDWANGYDCWVPLDSEVSVSKYHKEDYRMIGKIVEINEDNGAYSSDDSNAVDTTIKKKFNKA